MPLPQLWAREKIRDLEEFPVESGSKQSERKQKKAQDIIIEISKTYGILSRYTSYLGIEKRSRKDKTTGQVELRRVPALVTSGWHGMRTGAPAAMPDGASRFFANVKMDSFKHDRTTVFDVSENITMYQEAAASPKISDKTNILFALLSAQQVAGGFIIDEKIARLINLDLKQITKLSKELQTGLTFDRHTFISTLLVFEILETYYADEAKTWRAATNKSRRWLDNIIKKEMPQIEGHDTTTWAHDFVQNNITIKSN